MTRHRQARIYGLVLFLLGVTPTVLLLIALYSGAVGSAPRRGLLLMALAVTGLVAAGAGVALHRALDAVDVHPGRTPADAWVAAYVGATIFIIGTVAIPVVMLMVMVNSDRSLQDSGAWFFVVWTVAHALIAAAALGLARLAFGRSTEAADKEAEPVAAGSQT